MCSFVFLLGIALFNASPQSKAIDGGTLTNGSFELGGSPATYPRMGPSCPTRPTVLGVSEARLTPIVDTTLDAWNPTRSYASVAILAVRTPNVKRSLLRFDISSIPLGATIRSARLSVQVAGRSNTNSIQTSAYKVLRDWNSNATWNSTGIGGASWAAGGAMGSADISNTPLANVNMNASTSIISLNVTSLVNSWKSAPTTNKGVLLSATSTGNVQYDFASAESTKKPVLIISYETSGPVSVTPTPPRATITGVPCQGGLIGASWQRTGPTTVYQLFSLDTSIKHGGTKSQKVETAGAGVGVRQSVLINPTGNTTLSAWVYVVKGGVSLKLLKGDTVLSTVNSSQVGSWQKLTIPINTTQLRAGDAVAIVSRVANSVFYLDEVVYPVTGSSPTPTSPPLRFEGDCPSCEYEKMIELAKYYKMREQGLGSQSSPEQALTYTSVEPIVLYSKEFIEVKDVLADDLNRAIQGASLFYGIHVPGFRFDVKPMLVQEHFSMDDCMNEIGTNQYICYTRWHESVRTFATQMKALDPNVVRVIYVPGLAFISSDSAIGYFDSNINAVIELAAGATIHELGHALGLVHSYPNSIMTALGTPSSTLFDIPDYPEKYLVCTSSLNRGSSDCSQYRAPGQNDVVVSFTGKFQCLQSPNIRFLRYPSELVITSHDDVKRYSVLPNGIVSVSNMLVQVAGAEYYMEPDTQIIDPINVRRFIVKNHDTGGIDLCNRYGIECQPLSPGPVNLYMGLGTYCQLLASGPTATSTPSNPTVTSGLPTITPGAPSPTQRIPSNTPTVVRLPTNTPTPTAGPMPRPILRGGYINNQHQIWIDNYSQIYTRGSAKYIVNPPDWQHPDCGSAVWPTDGMLEIACNSVVRVRSFDANCNTSETGTYTATAGCPAPTPVPSAACSADQCVNCVINNSQTNVAEFFRFYQRSGWNTSCDMHDDIIANWCNMNDGNRSTCASLRTGACMSVCAPTPTITPVVTGSISVSPQTGENALRCPYTLTMQKAGIPNLRIVFQDTVNDQPGAEVEWCGPNTSSNLSHSTCDGWGNIMNLTVPARSPALRRTFKLYSGERLIAGGNAQSTISCQLTEGACNGDVTAVRPVFDHGLAPAPGGKIKLIVDRRNGTGNGYFVDKYINGVKTESIGILDDNTATPTLERQDYTAIPQNADVRYLVYPVLKDKTTHSCWSPVISAYSPQIVVNSVTGGTECRIVGWARDQDDPNTPVRVEVFKDSAPPGGNKIASLLARDYSTNLATRFQTNGNHGFNISLRSLLGDNVPHTLYITARNTTGTKGSDFINAWNTQTSNNQFVLQCAP